MTMVCFLETRRLEVLAMKKLAVVSVLMILVCALVSAQAVTENPVQKAENVQFTDSCGRTVEIPADVTKVAVSGNVATIFMASIAPEYMCNVNSTPTAAQLEYLPAVLATLPATGQLYGGKATINYEELIATGAQVMIDMGDYKKGIAEDLDALQAQIGIPCIFLEADLPHMADAFRSLGTILSEKAERADELAFLVDRTLIVAEVNKDSIPQEERLSVMFTSGSDGLGTNAKGSSQAQVIEIVGAENAIVVDKVSSKGGGNIVSLEQVYKADPDVIIFSPDSIYSTVASDPAWKELRAIKEGRYYEVPGLPYNWMSMPPSLNMILGIWWLGNVLYPQYYDYDMISMTQDFYKVLWNCELSAEQAKGLLGIN